MWCKAAAFLAVFPPLLATTHTTESSWRFDNPFCGVIVQARPLAGTPGYALQLGAATGEELDAHVTLVSDSDAYDAYLSNVRLAGPPDDRQSNAKLVTLPRDQTVSYLFVDSYSIDHGPSQTCPSYVVSVESDPFPVPPDSAAIVARHLQSLGKPACGQVYRSPGFNGEIEFPIGDFGNRRLSTTFDVYIDSRGRAISETMVASSGIEGVDDFARGAIQHHQFRPAEFLCTPVVAELQVRLNYEP
ncbi:MAG: hypothetical protein JO078_05070 [Candidatus Eremiobacteraeota bacterium]|nr:hypothetical protein [Candidatus Eremiobacteraeota bacterium]MBV9057428.1 hypothetical protein [Candidatus Eremiobacteraeota bacterium]MBV9699479.1 hypothetical protein [Candidatus Eremiobacteraeota bacterium]